MELGLTPTEGTLVKLCIFSRLIIFILQLIISPLPDHNADAFRPPLDANDPLFRSPLELVFRDFLLTGLAKWDSLHFLHVAEHGYVFESDLAFFPGFPLALNTIDAVLQPLLSSVLTKRTRLLIAAMLLNNVSFIVSCVLLNRLVLQLVGSSTVAFLASLFFAFNPASVFFSVAYSESLFFLCSLFGLLLCYRGRLFLAAFAFALCSFVRSNGVVFIGFFWFFWINSVWKIWAKTGVIDKVVGISLETLKTLVYSAISLSLYLAYQRQAALTFCTDMNDNQIGTTVPLHLMNFAAEDRVLLSSGFRVAKVEEELRLVPGDLPQWCTSWTQFSYSSVQNKYWQLGLFKYYRLKQIPNFMLAFPVILLTGMCLLQYFTHMVKNKTLIKMLITSEDKTLRSEFSTDLIPLYIYTGFLLVFGLCFMHVQVLTRLLFSSAPVLYLFVGSKLAQSCSWSDIELILNKDSFNSLFLTRRLILKIWRNQHKLPRLFISYSCLYFILGVIFHSKFLPWT